MNPPTELERVARPPWRERLAQLLQTLQNWPWLDTARTLGPQVERDARFRNRTNVQLLEVLDEQNIRIQIWERGAGYTLASGSSASAAACAAHRLGACGGHVTVHMPGGALEVEIGPDYEVTQTGPATRVAEGTISAEGLSNGAGWSALGR